MTGECPYCGKHCELVRYGGHWDNCGDVMCMEQASADVHASEGRPGIRGLE